MKERKKKDICVGKVAVVLSEKNQQKCMSTTARFQIFDYHLHHHHHHHHCDHSFVHRV
jgi:hypothetical protein